MDVLVECVPNFSEGRDREVIDAIGHALGSAADAWLLDVDAGASTNRTVYTVVGSPDGVLDAVLRAARVARDRIDMSKHAGSHPRIGAMDVCPFVPLRHCTMQDCVSLALRCAHRLADELHIPVYLYEEAQQQDYRKTLPQIREGDYEKLEQRMTDARWKPDLGPTRFDAAWGASCVGARPFLVAYNVNVLATKEQAHRIALNIREQGRGPGQPGKFRCVRAIGWYLEEANLAQVSINLTNVDVTSMQHVFDACVDDAKTMGVAIAGSEIVGLVPLSAVVQAAEHFARKEQLFVLEEEHKVRLAIERLGLSSLHPFEPRKRIVEYILEDRCGGAGGPLLRSTVRDFVQQVSSRKPAPGGGSVGALVAAMGVALATMTALLSSGNRKFEHLDATMRSILPDLHRTVGELLLCVDEDSNAFRQYVDAFQLPDQSPQDKERKQAELKRRLRTAIDVPLNVARKAAACWPLLDKLAQDFNTNAKSDLQVATKCLETGIFAAVHNVNINRSQGDGLDEVGREADALWEEAQRKAALILQTLGHK